MRKNSLNYGERQTTGPLYDSLVRYGEADWYPCHMPGHKRRGVIEGFSDFFQIDITEIDDFDNLHQAEGIIRQAQERAAALYGAEETFFLVNGSTCGILSAISAVADRGDTILIARNCHKSVYHAAFLKELHVKYLCPGRIAEFDISDAVSPAAVKEALARYPECRAVVITSPTYEGLISDIREIGRIVHEKGKILIVDEAHGAHLGLSREMPENAVKQGADIVIHSLHKTLPSMTQTALLHVNGKCVNRRRLRHYLSIYQSSSPSYVLMAGMDACISYMKKNAPDCFARLTGHYEAFMRRTEKCRHIRIGAPRAVPGEKYCFRAWDICKIVISVKGTSVSGQALYEMLRNEFHIQPEMAAGSYALAIMTVADEEAGWQRLAEAILRIDERIGEEMAAAGNSWEERARCAVDSGPAETEDLPPVRLTIAQALNVAHDRDFPDGRENYAGNAGGAGENGVKEIALGQAAGRISGDFICIYPPGIPLVVPGEVIEACTIRRIEEGLRMGLHVQGLSDEGTVIIC